VHAHGHTAVDLEVGVEAPAAVGPAVLVREVGGGGEAGQGADDAAIDGRQDVGDLPGVQGAGAGQFLEQLADDAFQACGVEDGDGFGEGTQGGPRTAESAL